MFSLRESLSATRRRLRIGCKRKRAESLSCREGIAYTSWGAVFKAQRLNNGSSAAADSLVENEADARERLVAGFTGTSVVRQMRQVMTEFDPPLHDNQKTVVHHYMQSMIPVYYKNEWDTHGWMIRDYHGLGSDNVDIGSDPVNPNVVTCMPRRFGKSTVVAQFVAALMYCCRGVKALIFSPRLVQAKDMMKNVKMYFHQLEGAAERIGENNVQKLSVKVDVAAVINELECLAGNALSARGQGADLIILEEAAFVTGEFMTQGILPMMREARTRMFAISTPSTVAGSVFGTMMKIKDNDTEVPMLKVINLSQMCDVCIEEQKTECNCKDHVLLTPPWIANEKELIVKRLYESLNAMDDLRRELSGLSIEADRMSAFTVGPLKILSALLLNKEKKDGDTNWAWVDWQYLGGNDRVRDVYMAIDPSGGGGNSDTAIVTFTVIDKRTVILAMDSLPLLEANPMIVPACVEKHAHFVRQKLRLYRAALHVIMEANGDWIRVGQLKQFMDDQNFTRRFGKALFAETQVRDQYLPGVLTTEKTKELYVSGMDELLQYKSLSVLDGFFTIQKPVDGRDGRDVMLSKLVFQLNNFKRHLKRPTEAAPEREAKVRFHGKANGNKDDLLMALLFGIYYGHKLEREDQYLSGTLDSVHTGMIVRPLQPSLSVRRGM